jgi:hypothetical protein
VVFGVLHLALPLKPVHGLTKALLEKYSNEKLPSLATLQRHITVINDSMKGKLTEEVCLSSTTAGKNVI